MDFPVERPQPVAITTVSEAVFGTTNWGASAPSSAVWPGSANSASLVPFVLQEPYVVRKVAWVNGATVVGSVDVGVYTLSGVRVFSSGGTTQAGTSAVQIVTLGSPVVLPVGSYYLALAASLATATFFRQSMSSTQQLFGLRHANSAYPLPDQVTLTTAFAYIPMFGISSGAIL